jgi:hypothetical protein
LSKKREKGDPSLREFVTWESVVVCEINDEVSKKLNVTV